MRWARVDVEGRFVTEEEVDCVGEAVECVAVIYSKLGQGEGRVWDILIIGNVHNDIRLQRFGKPHRHRRRFRRLIQHLQLRSDVGNVLHLIELSVGLVLVQPGLKLRIGVPERHPLPDIIRVETLSLCVFVKGGKRFLWRDVVPPSQYSKCHRHHKAF